ncbi:MAG: type II toxin-antitoxin system RelE/ParE family toxin [Patescibacteria group bacterium]
MYHLKKHLQMLIRLAIKAQKQLEQLDMNTKRRLKKKLAWYILHDDPLVFADTLTDSELGQYRYRIGDYRVIFDVADDTIRINQIGHRKEIYR